MKNVTNPITDEDRIPFVAPSARKPKRVAAEPVLMTEAMLQDKESIREVLREGVHTVVFKKVDGSTATMDCTLDPVHLPQIDPTKINVRPRSETPEPEHLLHVYSIDRAGWRSFVVPNVLSIEAKGVQS